MVNIKKLLSCCLILGALLGRVYAAEDPRLKVYPPQEAMIFKGLDEKSSPIFLKDGYATTANNVNFSDTGGLKKRTGFVLVKDFDVAGIDYDAVTGIYYVKFSSGTAYRITTASDRFWYETGGTWTNAAGSSLFTVDKNNQFVFTTALDTVVFTNNVDVVKKWTAAGTPTALGVAGLSSALTKANAAAWFKNYLILGNTTEGGTVKATRIRWSNVGTIETWSNDNYIDIGELGGQEIVGFSILGDNLYVLMTDSIHRVSLVGGDEIFNVSKVVEGVGCIAKNSIQNISIGNSAEGFAFLSKDKVIYFFDGVNLTDISYYIPTTMDGLSTSRLPYTVSCTDGSDYYLSASNGTSTTNNLVIDINLDTGDISKQTNIFANAMADVLDSDGNVQLYFGNYDSHLLKMNVSGQDNDVDGYTGIVDSVGTFTTNTASSIQVIFDSANNFLCTGAVVTLISGTGDGEQRIVTGQYLVTGLIVDNAFSATPDTTTQYSIGEINADYITKWYSFGEPARRKHFGELYLWAKTDSNSFVDINYAKDFGSYAGSQSIDLSGAGGLWGTAVWGTAVWGGEDAVFKIVKLLGDGKFIRFRIQEDDIDESFNIYGFSVLRWDGDIL